MLDVEQLSFRFRHRGAAMRSVGVLAAMAFCLGGCIENNMSATPSPALFSLMKGYIGTKLPLKTVVDLCKSPDFRINQQGSCEIYKGPGPVTIMGISETRGYIFVKLRTADGKEGFIDDESFWLLKQLTHPSPRVGMTEDEASGTSWGSPEKKNITQLAGHQHEQWVFPSLGYLYIDDGVLRAIQRIE